MGEERTYFVCLTVIPLTPARLLIFFFHLLCLFDQIQESLNLGLWYSKYSVLLFLGVMLFKKIIDIHLHLPTTDYPLTRQHVILATTEPKIDLASQPWALNCFMVVLIDQHFFLDENGDGTRIVASHDEADLGEPGGDSEEGAIRQGKIYYGKYKGRVDLVMPLRDRNGEPVAAVRVQMDSFFGQTENNALARARPVVQHMQNQLATSQEVFR